MSRPDPSVVDVERALSVQFLNTTKLYAVEAKVGNKVPENWNPSAATAATSAQVLQRIEHDDCNIGAHFFGRVVDVDVDGDDPNLTAALDLTLPSCSHVWGRKSRPRTHRAYGLRDGKGFEPERWPVLKRLKRIEGLEVEVRGGLQGRGTYSLLPGSQHPSGERYEWSDMGRARSTVAETTAGELMLGLRRGVAVALLARHWNEGVRQELTCALAGFLHRASAMSAALGTDPVVDREVGLDVLKAVLEVSGDAEADRHMRMKGYEATWKKADRGAQVTGATTMAKVTGDEDLVSNLYMLLTDNPDVEAIEEFSSNYAIWQGPAVMVDLGMVERGEAKPFMKRAQFNDSHGHRYVEMSGKRRLLPDLLWHLASTRRVEGLTFDPSCDERFVVQEGREMVNLWSGFGMEPAERATVKSVKPFLEYLREVVAAGREDRFQWVLQWLADVLQNPADKPGTALVLVGTQGAGKSFLGTQVMRPILGSKCYAHSNHVENVTTNFNTMYSNRLFIQCDEATSSSQRSVSRRLKSLITDPVQRVEPKGVDAYMLPMHARFLFTSNDEHDALHVSEGASDRRYTVLKVSAERTSDSKYWTGLVEWLEGNLPKVMRHLLDVEVDRALVSRPLMTEEKRTMQQSSWHPMDQWLGRMLMREHPLGDAAHDRAWKAFRGTGYRGQKVDRTEWPEYVSMDALLEDFKSFMRDVPARDRVAPSEGSIGRYLRESGLLGDGAGKRIRVFDFDDRAGVSLERRVRVYPAPDRAAIEEHMAKRYGYDWNKVMGEREFDEVDASSKEDEGF